MGVRHVLCLLSGTHCNLLPLLNESLPVSLDVCKRSARFILSRLKSKSKVVRSVATFSVLFGRHESIIGSNAIFCCSQFNWNFSDFFPCRLLIPVTKFCITIICMMLMTVIGVVPLYWLNWSLYATGCQISVFLMVACLHTTMCVIWFRILRCRNFLLLYLHFLLAQCTYCTITDNK